MALIEVERGIWADPKTADTIKADVDWFCQGGERGHFPVAVFSHAGIVTRARRRRVGFAREFDAKRAAERWVHDLIQGISCGYDLPVPSDDFVPEIVQPLDSPAPDAKT